MPSASVLCAEASLGREEPQWATASRVDTWVLVEYPGEWPYEPLDSVPFAGLVRDRVTAQLALLPHARLLLVKRTGRRTRRPFSVMVGSSSERGPELRRVTLEKYTDLLELELGGVLEGGERITHPLLLVCTHGKRDRCCAKYGQALCSALHDRRDSDWVWQASHVGGDRFAGNLVCLPEGLYFGRVGRAEADAVVDSYRAGRIEPAHYRGRSCYAPYVQAAERRVREETGLTGIHDLRLAETVARGDGRWTISFAAELAGMVHDVDVERRLGPAEQLTCRAPSPKPARHYAATAHRLRR